MPSILSRKPIVSKESLREIAEERLLDAQGLLEQGRAAGCIYLAGYSVECYLKVAICTTLNWEALLGTFRVHDLDGLLLYSGLDRELRSSGDVFNSFAKVSAIWTVEGDDSVRYRTPAGFDIAIARRFLEYVSDTRIGVVPWLRKRV